MLKLHDTYTVLEHYLPALFYDDRSGLDDADETCLARWLVGIPSSATFDVSDDAPEYARCAISLLYGQCVTVSVYRPYPDTLPLLSINHK